MRTDITLYPGGHADEQCRNGERCLFEWYNWLDRRSNTDSCPPGVSPLLHSFGMTLNDRLPDGKRQQLAILLPNGVSPLAGTAGDGHDERRGGRQRDTGPRAHVRAAVLARDGYACVRCGRACGPGIGPYSIQHRKARGVGGGNEMSNLILLCGSATTGCHGEVEQRAWQDEGFGYWVRSSADPKATGVLYFLRDSSVRFYLHDDGSLSGEPDRGAGA